jgi:hypothetical protein
VIQRWVRSWIASCPVGKRWETRIDGVVEHLNENAAHNEWISATEVCQVMTSTAASLKISRKFHAVFSIYVVSHLNEMYHKLDDILASYETIVASAGKERHEENVVDLYARFMRSASSFISRCSLSGELHWYKVQCPHCFSENARSDHEIVHVGTCDVESGAVLNEMDLLHAIPLRP